MRIDTGAVWDWALITVTMVIGCALSILVVALVEQMHYGLL